MAGGDGVLHSTLSAPCSFRTLLLASIVNLYLFRVWDANGDGQDHSDAHALAKATGELSLFTGDDFSRPMSTEPSGTTRCRTSSFEAHGKPEWRHRNFLLINSRKR